MKSRFIALFILLCSAHAAPAAAWEPPPRAVQVHALRQAGLDGPLDRWSGRARWSHLLPRVEGSVGRTDQYELDTIDREYLGRNAGGELSHESTQSTTGDKSKLRVDYGARATIDFSGLIFDRDELAASREVRKRLSARLKLLDAVNDAYFRRQRALLDLRRAPASEAGRRADIVLARDMATAELDALTGGWFSRAVEAGEVTR